MICTPLPILFGVIKSRRMRRVVHVAPRGEKTGAYRVLVGRPVGKSYLEDICVKWRIILKWIFKN